MHGHSNPNNILLTGRPGCGKSTAIERIVQRLDRPSMGFFSREMREGGRRVGFSITTLDGRRGILAHVDIRIRERVGRYGINLQHIDEIAVPSIQPEHDNIVVVVDEIGRMECFSAMFRKALVKILDRPNFVLGSIALKGDAFITAIKKRTDTRLIAVTEKGRDQLAQEILSGILHG